MKIVIDIDEKYYTDIKESDHCSNYSVLYALDAIRNGIPLPKGHGRLIDTDEYERIIRTYIDENKNSEDMFLAGCGDGAYHAMCMLKDISTIIEADKEGEDD